MTVGHLLLSNSYALAQQKSGIHIIELSNINHVRYTSILHVLFFNFSFYFSIFDTVKLLVLFFSYLMSWNRYLSWNVFMVTWYLTPFLLDGIMKRPWIMWYLTYTICHFLLDVSTKVWKWWWSNDDYCPASNVLDCRCCYSVEWSNPFGLSFCLYEEKWKRNKQKSQEEWKNPGKEQSKPQKPDMSRR